MTEWCAGLFFGLSIGWFLGWVLTRFGIGGVETPRRPAELKTPDPRGVEGGVDPPEEFVMLAEAEIVALHGILQVLEDIRSELQKEGRV